MYHSSNMATECTRKYLWTSLPLPGAPVRILSPVSRVLPLGFEVGGRGVFRLGPRLVLGPLGLGFSWGGPGLASPQEGFEEADGCYGDRQGPEHQGPRQSPDVAPHLPQRLGQRAVWTGLGRDLLLHRHKFTHSYVTSVLLRLTAQAHSHTRIMWCVQGAGD